MTNSVQLDKEGPEWPLGFINVATPGTPVGIMTLVDPTGKNDPSNAVGGPTVGGGAVSGDEYTVRAQQILFQGYKPGAHGMVNNAGNIYIVRKGVGSGTGNRDDQGSTIIVLAAGLTFSLGSAPLNRNVFNPYRYFIDADNAGDGALVTLIIQ